MFAGRVLCVAVDEQDSGRLTKRGTDQAVALFVERGDGRLTGLDRLLEERDHDLEEPPSES